MLLKGGYAAAPAPAGAGARGPARRRRHASWRAARRLRPKAGEEVEDCRGQARSCRGSSARTRTCTRRWLAGHAGSARRPAQSFPEMLGRVWWKLDQALDEEADLLLRAWSAPWKRCKAGTTTIVDHHASPNAIPGSLDIIREAFGRGRRARRALLRGHGPRRAAAAGRGTRRKRSVPRPRRAQTRSSGAWSARTRRSRCATRAWPLSATWCATTAPASTSTSRRRRTTWLRTRRRTGAASSIGSSGTACSTSGRCWRTACT